MKPLKLTNVRKGGINSPPTTNRPSGTGTTKINTKNQRSLICPYCKYKFPKLDHTIICTDNLREIINCPKCDATFTAKATTIWSTWKGRR